jgi:drug/metabolite transporter (DMT)-like permease
VGLTWILIAGLFLTGPIALGRAWVAWARRPPSTDRADRIATSLCFGVMELGVVGMLLGCTLLGRFSDDQMELLTLAAGIPLLLTLVLSFLAGLRAQRWYLKNASRFPDFAEGAMGNPVRPEPHD